MKLLIKNKILKYMNTFNAELEWHNIFGTNYLICTIFKKFFLAQALPEIFVTKMLWLYSSRALIYEVIFI